MSASDPHPGQAASYRPLTPASFSSSYGVTGPRAVPAAPAGAVSDPPEPVAPEPAPRDPAATAASSRMSVEDSLAEGRIADAAEAVERLLAADPADAEAWLLQARVLERQDRFEEALEASHRAVSLWPDVTPAHRLRLRLAQRAGDGGLAVQALRHLLIADPEDPGLNSEMGARLSEAGAFDQAVPFLRIAAPVLLHENCSIWNYTTALGVTGRHQELIEAQPLLDRMAAEDADTPYPPYSHLAAARLAAGLDEGAVIGAARALQASRDWLDVDALYARLTEAIGQKEPFSLIRLDHALARFICYTSLRVHLALRPPELAAVADSVWRDWFEDRVETAGAAAVARLARGIEAAIGTADVVGLPEADVIRHDRTNFGFLAEMQRRAIETARGRFTSFQFATELHRSMPFLRPLLQGLPFLCVVGSYPELARRLGHFCGIADTRSILLPDGDGAEAAESRLQRSEQILAELEVPFRGALFLVAAPGPAGLLFCGRIKALGGIALDIGAVAASWAGR